MMPNFFKLTVLFSHLVVGISIFAARPALCQKQPIAVTTTGTVAGLIEEGNYVWRGIPYAQSTGGQNRWKSPQPLENQETYFNATAYGFTCPQAYRSTFNFTAQDEDCLNLNIWTPASGKKLPVFVYIYGGAMVTGSNSDPTLTGANFAAKGVIYVNLNHRMNIFGFPNSPELEGVQNFGIQDVAAALDWIHENIAAFGGDPSHIVLGGHSSGSVMVDHYLWTHKDTWLAGAIEMSANAVSGPPYALQPVGLNTMSAEVGCPTGTGQLACLRTKSIFEIETANFNSTYNTWFAPIIDNTTYFKTYDAARYAESFPKNVPLVVGNADKEGAIFGLIYSFENSPFSSWIETFDAALAHIPSELVLAAYNQSLFASVSAMSGQSYGDARFNCAHDYLVDLRAGHQKVWQYRWFGDYDNILGIPGLGPSHGSEVPFFHGGNDAFAYDIRSSVTPAEQALADFMNDWLVAYIKNPSAGPGWGTTAPVNGTITEVGVPGLETTMVAGASGTYNAICQSLYKPWFPDFPVVQDPTKL
ncbi:Alpha/Beta hydrolase protein [Sphaerosporella brunnea]|uniref:Carboxylic ester hydrolase n=1 Tax=Sphaerosporella brunnea TaxID=1250544 RepID=A0A5J5EUE4_9PEZI|nr:Alpha/Beta hydrolase protein [Sphaerosporella brunnea]